MDSSVKDISSILDELDGDELEEQPVDADDHAVDENIGKKGESKNEVDVEQKAQDVTSEEETKAQTNKKEKLELKEQAKIDPLKFFNEQQKAWFNSQSTAVQKMFLSTLNPMQKVYEHKTLEYVPKIKEYEAKVQDYQARHQEYEPKIREHEEIAAVVAPYEQDLRQAGISRPQYIQHLVNEAEFASKDPVEFLVTFIKSRNLDDDTINSVIDRISASRQAQANPLYHEIEPIQRQLNELTNYIRKNQSAQSNAVQQNTYSADTQLKQSQAIEEVNKFKDQRDEDGNLAYPHFSAVRKDMAKLLDVNPNLDLKTLYMKAVRLNDDLYQQTLETERTKAIEEQVDVVRKQKAKKALGINTKDSPSDSGDKKRKQTLDEMLMELDPY